MFTRSAPATKKILNSRGIMIIRTLSQTSISSSPFRDSFNTSFRCPGLTFLNFLNFRIARSDSYILVLLGRMATSPYLIPKMITNSLGSIMRSLPPILKQFLFLLYDISIYTIPPCMPRTDPAVYFPFVNGRTKL